MDTQTQNDVPTTDVRESDPNGASAHGLEGDMGISSERTGPAGSVPVHGAIEGTGSHGSAARDTVGVMDTSTGDVPRQHPDEPAEGGDPDEEQPEVERTSTEEPAEGPDDPDHTSVEIDRTVGEPNPAPVANKHEFDPSKNPRH
ncbi:MAG TPA: hypothetical protein VER39_07195 [Nocardioidaceae bacterium]|nr:hypothetical protein [Nocardioidaceae bacterium]